jgi:hypothetical protein
LVVDVEEEEGGKERKGSKGKETQHKSNHGLKP